MQSRNCAPGKVVLVIALVLGLGGCGGKVARGPGVERPHEPVPAATEEGSGKLRPAPKPEESAESHAKRARAILTAADVKGGLVVLVGCEDGRLAAALGANDRFVVQGLSEEVRTVAAAREHVKSAGKYGHVSIAAYDGKHLPYVENLVNLLVVSRAGGVPAAEIKRVLIPGGTALVKDGQHISGLTTGPVRRLKGWKVYEKPWPESLDEWTHYLHDPRGTSVSDDLVAGHPKGLRWTGGPFWARSHEHTAGMYAMVSAAGRAFYVMDEGPTESIQLPPEYFLTARDAFNGTVLWKRPLHDWFNHLFPLKSGPGWIPRRLVAVKDRVYLAPGIGQDLLCLDAATGKVLRKYGDTASTFELIVSDGVIFAAVDPDRKPCDYRQEHPNCWRERGRASKRWGWKREGGARVVRAIEAEGGKLLWKREMPVAPMTLSADKRMVCLYDGSAVIALDRGTGKDLWKADVSDMQSAGTGYAGPRLVICEDRVVFSPMGHIFAISAEGGEILWSVKGKPRSGHFSLEDFYVIGDKVWVLGRRNNGVFTTYSLEDGRKLKDHSNPIRSFYIHQRCYPGRATRKCLLPPMMGMMVYEIEEDEWTNNHWVRGGCTYGVMPANGMVYAVPHACACYYQSKLNGFNALSREPQPAEAPPAEERLVKGPAFGKCDRSAEYPASEWPTFRHDNPRSGHV